jgi:lipopolysaccharide/colanic/teichoic acid biosynthesis glycosyltransferase
MLTGWRYRVVSSTGTALLSLAAVLFANHPTVQQLFTSVVPVFNRLSPTVLTGEDLVLAIGLTTGAICASLVPLYKPRPRRILDTIALSQKRVVVAGLGLATLGYFQWSHRLPRATLTLEIAFLLVVIPLWFTWMRRSPVGESRRAIIVGDDLDQIAQIALDADLSFQGYLCPTARIVDQTTSSVSQAAAPVADGGTVHGVERLGGLSRIEDVLVEYDIDTVVLAFEEPDRGEFFGTLDACYEHGVTAKVHREHADTVLTAEDDIGTLADIEIEPWDIQDYVIKRLFDISFAAAGLIVLSPVIIAIAVVIKLDSAGPVLYEQRRTAIFGEAFTVYKFRTMETGSERVAPEDSEQNSHVTDVGRVLRPTHLDEIPQLWTILIGDMSVVGPRAIWMKEEQQIENLSAGWRKRWFVKPGLTGLAQINGAGSEDPEKKLRYDLQYIRRQSFRYDLKIVFRQVWRVAKALVRS